MASTDSLTGLLTRRSMLRELEEAVSTGEKFALLLMDIDDFTFFNDRYGHECGDMVLLQCASTIKSLLRREDDVARWGGEEFLILLRNVQEKEATNFADMIRQKIYKQPVTYKDIQLSVSVTIGVAMYGYQSTIEETIHQADRALLVGKANGKNRVEII